MGTVQGQASEIRQLGYPPSRRRRHFEVGDKVKVQMDLETLKVMQNDNGGWNPCMADFIGKLGTVHRVIKNRYIRVKYEGYPNIWMFHPGALTKVRSVSNSVVMRDISPIGEMLRVIDNPELVKELQTGQAEELDVMQGALGKMDGMVEICSGGDSRVGVDVQTLTFKEHLFKFIFNILFLLKFFHFATVGDFLLGKQQPSISSDKLVKECAQGHMEVVCNIICKFPIMLDLKSSGKTALQVACHQGHLDIVLHLLAVGSNMGVKDDDGDTALHYAAFGNQHEVLEHLVKKGAPLNAVNKAHCSALHVAVNKQHIQCIRVLLKYRCNVNIKDSNGDTALHHAVRKGNTNIIELLVKFPGLDFSLKNKQGFSALHHAAFKGNNSLEKFRSALLRVQIQKKLDCLNCFEYPANVSFEPCCHTVTCIECCQRMKKCVLCQEVILKKTGPAGRPISSKLPQVDVEKLLFLENKIQEFEEAQCCSICMERSRDVAFLCGHNACDKCAETLSMCHMCRKPIDKRIKLFD